MWAKRSPNSIPLPATTSRQCVLSAFAVAYPSTRPPLWLLGTSTSSSGGPLADAAPLLASTPCAPRAADPPFHGERYEGDLGQAVV